MRNISIDISTANRWYNGTDAELKALALQTYPELAVKELPKTWEELEDVKGYYVNGAISTIAYFESGSSDYDRNIFATKEQAEASIAMAQLSQLMAVYNDGWVADWSDETKKIIIVFYEDKFICDWTYSVKYFLNFKNEETAELFLENFSSLINTAKPLL